MMSPDRHKIRSYQGPPKKAMSSRTGDLEIRSKRPIAVYADTYPICPDYPEGRLNVAYIMRNSVSVFRADLQDLEQPRLVLLKPITIDEGGSSDEWTGVALGGEYLVVWGKTGERPLACLCFRPRC